MRVIVDRPDTRGYGQEGAGQKGLLPWAWVESDFLRTATGWCFLEG